VKILVQLLTALINANPAALLLAGLNNVLEIQASTTTKEG